MSGCQPLPPPPPPTAGDADSIMVDCATPDPRFGCNPPPPPPPNLAARPEHCANPAIRQMDPGCYPHPTTMPSIDLLGDEDLRARGLRPITTSLQRRVWCLNEEGAVVACKEPTDRPEPVGYDERAACEVYGHEDTCARLGLHPPFANESDEHSGGVELIAADGNNPSSFKPANIDFTCGAGTVRVRPVDGPTGPGAESCHWSKFHQRFLCTVAATPVQGAGFFDGFGWITQALSDGTFWSPNINVGEPPGAGQPLGWASYAWDAQAGGGYILGNPLGITSNPTTGMIYVVEGGKVDWDLDPATPDAPAIQVFTPSFQPSHVIPMVDAAGQPLVTINDVARAPLGNLLVTDSAFADAAPWNKSRIFSVLNPDQPGAAIVLEWASFSAYPRPNAIKVKYFDNADGMGMVETVFVSTLGTQLANLAQPNGRFVRMNALTQQKWAVGPNVVSDGLAFDTASSSVLVNDLWKAHIYRLNATTGAIQQTYDLSPYTYQVGGMDKQTWGPIFIGMYGAGRPGILRLGGS
ncbi:MAG: hypothetical protein ACTHU0_21430 [Kofleriaceae bacterium]